MTIRTRFAPSPTGYLHVGSARTALFCYLFAKKKHGVFILRIEDTDLERSTPEAVQAIHDGMNWLGLHPDEGPYYQTQRFARYQEVIEDWLTKGLAYRCICSKERLSTLRESQMQNKQKPRYDGCCRDLAILPEEKNFVVRFKNPLQGKVIVQDLVHGTVIFQNSELDDLIIARSDGTPTYNFTVVVDDADMNISHVIRGDDHLNNTPRQINMLKAMGATIPVYAHVPMILGEDGKKLSKRHGAVSVMEYRDAGFLPEALCNYLVRLGWSHGDQEIFSMTEMIDAFSLKHLSKSAAAFNPGKLAWLNQHYLKTLPPAYIAEKLAWHLQNLAIDSTTQGPALEDVVLALRERCKTLKEMAEASAIFYQNELTQPLSNNMPDLAAPIKSACADLASRLQKLDDWQATTIHDFLNLVIAAHQLKFAELGKPLRALLTPTSSPLPVHTLIHLLGKEKVCARLAIIQQ
jgi:glutamyl-tRNA synthetase